MRVFEEDEAMIFAICYGKQTALRERATSGSWQIVGGEEAGADIVILIERGWGDGSVQFIWFSSGK